MAPSHKREFGPRGFLIAGAIVTLIALLIALLAPKRPSAARRAVEAKLAELRAKGVPVTAEEIGRALPDPPPERDARVLLSEAFNFSPGPATKNIPIISDAMPRRRSPIPEATMQDMQAYLANSDLRLAAIPANLDGARFSMGWTNGFTNLLPHAFAEVRQLQQFLAIKALYESARGDHQKAAEALAKGFAVAATLNGDSLADAMTRVACAGQMCDTAEQALNRVSFTAEALHQIDRHVDPEHIDDFRNAFMVERHFGVLTFNDMQHSTRGLRRVFVNLVLRFRGRKPLYRDEDYLLFLNFNEQQIKLRSRPLLERVRGHEQLAASFRTNAVSLTAEMVMPNWSKAMRTAAETKARLVALKTALAIERFRLANGDALPTSLDALVPNYCSSAPRDPFDEQPLRYKKLARGYVLHSIGADGADSGGAERTNLKNLSDYDLTIIVER